MFSSLVLQDDLYCKVRDFNINSLHFNSTNFMSYVIHITYIALVCFFMSTIGYFISPKEY